MNLRIMILNTRLFLDFLYQNVSMVGEKVTPQNFANKKSTEKPFFHQLFENILIGVFNIFNMKS